MSRKENDSISRRAFVKTAATAMAASYLAGAEILQASEETATPRPFLTPAEDFRTVARGNPRPHTLKGDALVKARLTPDTWRLEITADTTLAPPRVTQAAEIEKPLTIADKTALDLPTLTKLGKKHGVKYIKAMQCLNIDTPLGQGLWEGVPLSNVLRLCGRMTNVRRIYYWGFHNDDPKQIFQSSLSFTQVMETPPGELPVFLAYRLNGEPIPLERGGPVRVIVPWAFGFKSIKWLHHIFLTNEYQSNDTYALRNNDPESHLKTAAYVDEGPKQVRVGAPVHLTGQVISGLSGLKRVEYWVRAVTKESDNDLPDDAPELLRGPWLPCELEGQPEWDAILPSDTSTTDLLGFDPHTGQPRSWPPRYGMASYRATIRGLKSGMYEIRARAVDLNGFAQPEPRSQQKSGRNAIQVWKLEVVEA